MDNNDFPPVYRQLGAAMLHSNIHNTYTADLYCDYIHRLIPSLEITKIDELNALIQQYEELNALVEKREALIEKHEALFEENKKLYLHQELMDSMRINWYGLKLEHFQLVSTTITLVIVNRIEDIRNIDSDYDISTKIEWLSDWIFDEIISVDLEEFYEEHGGVDFDYKWYEKLRAFITDRVNSHFEYIVNNFNNEFK